MSALNGMAELFVAVTPNDSADLPNGAPTAGLLIGTAGNVSMIDRSGAVVTIALPAGHNPVSPRRIRATGTTATSIVALYL